MQLRFLTPLFALLACVSLASADGKNPTYADDVVPILRQHCYGCHGDGKKKGGLDLATFGAVMEGGGSGVVVKAGEPDKSRLYTLTAHTEEPKMPPKADRIPQAQLDTLKLWIEQGGRETSMSKVSVPAKPKVDIGLKAVGKGKPDGPPPMPQLGKLKLDPLVKARRPNAVLALAASPWAPLVAVGAPRQVFLYHADTGDLLGVLPYEYGQVNSLKFSRNAKYLLAAGGRGGSIGRAVLFNVETGEKVTEVGSSENDAILAADLSPDQTLIAVGTPTKMIRIYNTADGTVAREIKKHTDWVTAVEFSPDGVLLATGDRNGGLFVWESNTGREFHTLRGHTAMITDVSWRIDSNVLASGSEDTTIKLWEMENGGNIKNWGAHGGGVQSVRYSMDGRIASVGRDRVAKLWDGNGAVQKQFEAFPDLALRVAVTHDNSKVVAGDWSGLVKSFATADAKVVAAFDTNPLPLPERLKAAEVAVTQAEAKAKAAADAFAAAQVKAKQANDSFAALQANATKVAADLAAAQKAVTDHTNMANGTVPQVAPAKAEVDKQTAANTAAANKVASLEVSAAAYAAASKAVADAAAKAPQNPDLAAAAKAAAALATQHANDLTAAKTAATAAATALKTATDKHAALTKTVADNQAAAAEATKKVAALTPMVKPAADAVPPAKAAADAANAAVGVAKAAADAATAEIVAAKGRLERMKAQPAPK